MPTIRDLKPGDYILCLLEYDFMIYEFVECYRKSVRVKYTWDHVERKFPVEKCAHPDELIVCVQERWKGRNGRGGYRIERELYPELRVPAYKVTRQPGVNFGGVEGGWVLEEERPPGR